MADRHLRPRSAHFADGIADHAAVLAAKRCRRSRRCRDCDEGPSQNEPQSHVTEAADNSGVDHRRVRVRRTVRGEPVQPVPYPLVRDQALRREEPGPHGNQQD